VTDANLGTDTPSSSYDASALGNLSNSTLTFNANHDAGDTTVPTLVSLDVSTPHVDASTGEAHVQVLVHATDAGSGISYLEASFASTSGAQSQYASAAPPYDLVSGDDSDGFFKLDIVLPQWSETHQWNAVDVSLDDGAGNYVDYEPLTGGSDPETHDLDLVGGTHFFTNDAANGDNTAPAVKNITVLDTDPIDATNGASYRVHGTIELTDDFSGVSSADFFLTSPGAQPQWAPGGTTEVLDSGAPQLDASLDFTVDLPALAPSGAWSFVVIPRDRFGNNDEVFAASFPAGVTKTVNVDGRPDTTDPTLVSLDVPTTVDVTQHPASAVARVHVVDDLSGVGDYSDSDFVYNSGNAEIVVGRAGTDANDRSLAGLLVGGTALDSWYDIDIPFAQWGELGEWVVKSIVVTDAAGNATDEIDESSHVITVTGVTDNDQPTVSQVGSYVPSADVDAGAQIDVFANMSDAGSGIASAQVEFDGPNGATTFADLGYQPDAFSGFDYWGPAPIPRWTGVGTWKPTSLTVTDFAGNPKTYSRSDLYAFGLTDLVFTGTSDDTPPALSSISFSPTTVNLDGAPGSTTATLHVTDDASGLSAGNVVLTSPSGLSTADAYFDEGQRTSGTATDGTYAVRLTIPSNAEPGPWTLSEVDIEDVAGHNSFLGVGDVPELSVQVTNPFAPVFDGVVQGTVTDSTPAPVAGAYVDVCSDTTNGCSSTQTGADGGYTVSHLPDGGYTVYVYAPSGSTLESARAGATDELFSEPNHTAVKDFTLTAPVAMPPGVSVNGQQSTVDHPIVPTVFWQDPIQLAAVGCTGGTATFTMKDVASNDTVASGTLAEGAPLGHYAVTVPAPYPNHGTMSVQIAITGCAPTSEFDFNLYIDPSGNVVDTNGLPGSGAQVTLLRSSTPSGPYTAVPNGSAEMSPSNRANPDQTDASGHYGWDVVAGYYKVAAQKAGCYAPGSYNSSNNTVQPVVTSGVKQIPPAVTNLGITLDCTDIAPVAEFTQPSTAQRGVAVGFDAGSSKDANGSITSYHWDFGDGSTPVDTASPAVSHTYTVLGSFTPTLTVTDGQLSGQKTGSAVTVGDVPGAVSGLTATTGVHSVDLSWTTPAANNSAITGYDVTVTPGGQHLTPSGTSVTVSGLTANTNYTFTVHAVNGYGQGPDAQAQGLAGAVATKPVVTIGSRPAALTNLTNATVAFTATADPQTTLASVTCAVDGGAAASCTSPVSLGGLAQGNHSIAVTATDADGNAGSASYQWVVDNVAPSVTTTKPSSTTTLSKSIVVAWAGADPNGVAWFDVRYTKAAWNGKAGAPVNYKLATRSTSATFTGTPGYEYCFSVRARDQAGNTSAYSSAKCTAIPLDDRSLTASSGWKKLSSKAFYLGTSMQSTASGKTLTRKGAIAGRAVLIVDEGKGFGTINVLYNGKIVKKISLAATRTKNHVAITLPKVTRATTIVIKTTSTKKVQIDGLLLARI